MNFKYTTTIIMLLMILALSRGVVLHYQDFIHFDALTAHAEGDGGDGGSAGAGAGDGGSAGAGAGDGGSAGAGAGDGSSAGAGAGTPAPSGDIGGGGIVPVYGCMDSTATNYNPAATSQTGITCTYVVVVYGCMDSTATNYNSSATSQTGVTCTYPVIIYGCMDSTANNYNPAATSQTGITCTYTIYGCMDSTATNYNPSATSQTGVTCTYVVVVYGCMDSTATNYNSHATSQTGITCTYPAVPVYGCTDSKATNYNPSATVDDWSCAYPPAVVAACILTASPSTIQNGSSSTLSWTTTNMGSLNYFSINQGIGIVSLPNGSRSVSPSVTTTYVGTIATYGTSVSPSPYLPCSVTITVTPFTPLVLPATIRVNKVIVNDNGGTKVIADFPLFVDTTTVTSGAVNTFSPGAYIVTETNQPNYAASFSGDCNASGSITISAGQNKVCTITNNDIAVPPVPATIRVNKVIVNDNGGTKVIADFPLFVSGATVTSGAVNTFTPGTYTVTETNQPGYAASFSGDCNASGSITISAGQNKVCTITNNDIAVPPVPATIRVNKVIVNDNGGTKVIADFPLFVDTTTVTSGAVNTFSPGAYIVTETNQPNYAASFSGDCDATGHVSIVAGDHKVCTITNNDVEVVIVTPPPPSGGGGGGGGGGSHRLSVITLAALPHVGAQPLAYLYLSQIPQTGLDLGPIGTMIYWLVLIGIAFAFAYFMLFGAAPLANRSLRNFGSRVSLALNAQELAPVRETYAIPPASVQHEMSQTFAEAPEAVRGYSSYDGFKSFAQGGALSIEDLVKGLSREHSIRAAGETIAPAALAPTPRVEPIYEHIEPIYENVEPVMNEVVPEKTVIPADVRGFTAALLEGDRLAVFAGLRQHVRGSGASEQLISSVACLLDDAYRARIDGSACDPDIARMTARLTTPTLEKLVASLTTAIDSSYSTGATGAKLALTRALSILGA